MLKTKKRGQAALEFMLSYGWAILTVMVVLGSLIYIVPNQKSLTRTKCIFPPQIPCSGSALREHNLTISLSNGVGVSINNVEFRVISPVNAACTVSKTSLRTNEKFFVTCINNGVMNRFSDTKFILSGTYVKSQGAYNQTLTGETYVKYFK